MSDPGSDRVHLASLALILLEGRDFLRIRRPDDNRLFAVRPAGVVGRVSVILHAVFCKLLFCARRNIAHPKIPIADKNRAAAVRGKLCQGSIAQTGLWRAGHAGQFPRAVILRPKPTFVSRVINRYPYAPAIVDQIKLIGINALRIRLFQSGRVQRSGHAHRIVSGGLASRGRIGNHKRRQPILAVEIPEPIATNERGLFSRMIHQRNSARIQQVGGPAVIIKRINAAGLRLRPHEHKNHGHRAKPAQQQVQIHQA